MNNIQIEIKDFYGESCLNDGHTPASIDSERAKRGPRGFVEIYEIDEKTNKKILVSANNNLVTYSGREWLAERMVNVNNSSVTTTPDQFLCWFGLGSGGAPAGSPLNPTAPTNNDSSLDTEIPINSTDSTCADFHDGAYYKHPFDSVSFLQDTNNNNSYLILRIIITIGSDDANGYNISEAGLFVAESDSGGYSGSFGLYARTTFPTQVKTSSQILTFVWYVYI